MPSTTSGRTPLLCNVAFCTRPDSQTCGLDQAARACADFDSVYPLVVMSTSEILARLPMLTPDERERIRSRLDALDSATPVSPEEMRLIDERVAAYRDNPRAAGFVDRRRGGNSQTSGVVRAEVVLTPEARADVVEAASWYRNRSVRAALTRIEAHPTANIIVEAKSGARRALLRKFPRRVLYLVEGERIVVFAVMSHHRDDPTWRERLPR